MIEAVLAGGAPMKLDGLSAAERAKAELAEQFAFSVADVTDELVAEVRKHMTSDAQSWAFMTALYEIDMEARLRLVVGEVL